MKKVLLFLSAVCCSISIHAAPGWEVNSADYEYSMTVTGVVNMDNNNSGDADDLLAAFVDEQCRGVVTSMYNANHDAYYFMLTVFSNQFEGETLAFRFYDSSEGSTVDLNNRMAFSESMNQGSFVSPVTFSNTGSAYFVNLSLPSVAENQSPGSIVGTLSVEISGDVSYAFEPGNPDNAYFAIEHNLLKTAKELDFEEQSSFNPVVIASQGETEIARTSLSIDVINLNESPSGIELSNNTVDENAPAGTEIGTLAAIDSDLDDTHTYKLVPGMANNSLFKIEGNALITKVSFDYEVQQFYSVMVSVSDSSNASCQEEFFIAVNNRTETSVSLSTNPEAYKAYPNPCHDVLVISTPGNSGSQAAVYDVTGKRVLQVPLGNDKNRQVDVSDMEAGLYLIRFSENGEIITRKIIIK